MGFHLMHISKNMYLCKNDKEMYYSYDIQEAMTFETKSDAKEQAKSIPLGKLEHSLINSN